MTQIVFVHLFNDRSGSPKVLSQSIKAIWRKYTDIDVLTSNHDNGFLDGLPGRKRNIFYRRSENKLLTLIFYIISQIYLFFFCFRYWRKDVLFYVNTMMPFGAALAARLMGKRVIYHVHETSLKPRILKWFLRCVIEYTASKVIFVSRYLQSAESFKRVPQIVVYNGLEMSRVSVSALASDFNVLMICSLKKYKGILEFVSVAKLLACRRDISFTLVLNASQSEVDEFSKSVGRHENITFFSRHADVQQFYTRASVLLNLARPDECVETFGLTILEGMANGLPVIAPPVGGPAEIVSDGQEGYLISCYDCERISAAIQRMADDNSLYDMLSRKALLRAGAFDIKIFNARILDALDI